MTESRQPHSIDTAYTAASDALSDDAARRRRRAELMAALDETAAQAAITAPAAQPIRPVTVIRPRSNWWNMLAAACVIGLSSLLVLRMNDVAAPVEAPSRAVRSEATTDQASTDAAKTPAAAPPAPATITSATPQSDSLPAAEPQRRDPARQVQRRPSAAAAEPEARPLNESALSPAPESLAKAPPRAFPAEQTEAFGQRAEQAAGNPARAADSAPSPAQKSRLQSPPDQNELAAASRSAPAGASLGSAKVSPAPRPGWRSDGLIAAVEAGDLERIKRQLKIDAVDAEKDADGRSALAHAVLRADLPIVELLLAAGADRRLPDRAGLSPLDHAILLADPAILAAFEKRR